MLINFASRELKYSFLNAFSESVVGTIPQAFQRSGVDGQIIKTIRVSPQQMVSVFTYIKFFPSKLKFFLAKLEIGCFIADTS